MSDLHSTSNAVSQDDTLNEVIAHEDTLMQDGEMAPVTQGPSTAIVLTETQQAGRPVADTHEAVTGATEAPSLKVSTPEMPPSGRAMPSMGPPEDFKPEDLAMQRNPMITAYPSMVNPELASDTVEPPLYNKGHEEGSRTPDIPQETSVTGWLVPPPAEQPTITDPRSSHTGTTNTATAAAARPSRISFDGAFSSFALLHLLTQQYYTITHEIETFLQLKRVFRHLMFWNSDYLTLSEITFEWGDSYDDKDWIRLSAILAPTLMVDYTEVNGHKWDAMPAEDFVGIMSHIGFVGDPLVHTQHHIGASKWQRISEDEVIGHHQLRAAHQRYTALDMRVVENKGHGHAMIKHVYKKIAGEWKLAGLRPTVRWNEFEFEKIFKGF